MQAKPLLFLDIDGGISLSGQGSNDRPAGTPRNVDGVMYFLSPGSARYLLGPVARSDLGTSASGAVGA